MFVPDELIFGRPSALLQPYPYSIHTAMRILARTRVVAAVKTASMQKIGESKRLGVVAIDAASALEAPASVLLA